LGLLTINSFTAADEIIIPLQAQFFSDAVWNGEKWLKKVKSRLNKVKIGVFCYAIDGRKVLNGML
jgi:chromosome partitioning protein